MRRADQFRVRKAAVLSLSQGQVVDEDDDEDEEEKVDGVDEGCRDDGGEGRGEGLLGLAGRVAGPAGIDAFF